MHDAIVGQTADEPLPAVAWEKTFHHTISDADFWNWADEALRRQPAVCSGCFMAFYRMFMALQIDY